MAFNERALADETLRFMLELVKTGRYGLVSAIPINRLSEDTEHIKEMLKKLYQGT